MKYAPPFLAVAAFAVFPLTAQQHKGGEQDRPVARKQEPKLDSKTKKQVEVLQGLTKQMELAVEVGLIEEVEAKEILRKVRKRMRTDDKPESRTAREQYLSATAQLNELVKAGKVSREDADKRLAELRDRLGVANKPKGADDKLGGEEAWVQKAMAETKKAHLSGEITAEEARSRVRVIMDRAAKQKEAKDGKAGTQKAKAAAISAADYRRIHKRIKELVAQGRMTENEGKRKLAELRERVR